MVLQRKQIRVVLPLVKQRGNEKYTVENGAGEGRALLQEVPAKSLGGVALGLGVRGYDRGWEGDGKTGW